MNSTQAIKRAASAAGGPTALARAIGVTPARVSQWTAGSSPIPPSRCAYIEQASGVRCEELRPDFRWTRDHADRVVGYMPVRA